MMVRARYYTDPACPRSWIWEPALRRLMVEFGDNLSWTYVMGGLARDYTKLAGGSEGVSADWLDVAAAGEMPVDPRLWREGGIGSSYPACMAVEAAAEQAPDGGYRCLRGLREGLMCHRRKLDTTEALVEEARRAGLGVERFRVDLGSNAIVERFGADLEETRERGVELPAIAFGEGGLVPGPAPYDALREAAVAAGAEPVEVEAPGVEEALRRFGPMATAEVAEVCRLPGPRAPAELWRLATEWRVRPVRVLTGELWELG